MEEPVIKLETVPVFQQRSKSTVLQHTVHGVLEGKMYCRIVECHSILHLSVRVSQAHKMLVQEKLTLVGMVPTLLKQLLI